MTALTLYRRANLFNMKILRFYILVFLFPVMFVACEADVNLADISNKINLNSSVTIPLGSASINIGELLDKYNTQNDLMVGSNAEISFQAIDSVDFEFKKINLLENTVPVLKDFWLNPNGFPLPPLAANTTFPTLTDSVILDLGIDDTNQRIDSVLVKEALFSVTIDQTDFDVPIGNLSAKVSFPKSNSFQVSPVAYGVENSVVLRNFTLQTNKGRVVLKIEINAKTGANPLLLTSNSKVKFKITVNKLDFNVAYGFFPPTILSSNIQQFKFDFSPSMPHASIKLSNPKIDVTLKSNIGTYLIYKLNYLKSYINNDSTTSIFARFNNNTTNSLDLFVDKKPTKPGNWISKNFATFDNSNGRINTLLENLDKANTVEYKYSLVIDTNTVKNSPTASFITADPLMRVIYKATVPFELSPASYYEMVDSVSNGFDDLATQLNSIKQADIDSMILVLNVTNGLPVKAGLQLTYIDYQGNELKTDFQTSYSIESGTVNANGIVVPGKESNQKIQVLLTRAQIDYLKTAQYFRYKVRIAGKDLSSKIHFTTNDHIEIKAGVFLKCKVSSVVKN